MQSCRRGSHDESEEKGGIRKPLDVHSDDEKFNLLASVVLSVGIGNRKDESLCPSALILLMRLGGD